MRKHIGVIVVGLMLLVSPYLYAQSLTLVKAATAAGLQVTVALDSSVDGIEALLTTISGLLTGSSSLAYTSVGTTEDEHAVKATAGVLYGLTATNTNAAYRYLRCENDTTAGTAPGSETATVSGELDLAIPPGGFQLNWPHGIAFSTALTCWTVTGTAQSDVAEVAANEIKLLYSYK